MPLSKFIFRPGVNRDGTDYDNEGGWFDSNLIRFRNGSPQKIGGWAKDTLSTFLGKARALHGWVSLAGTKYLGAGTTLKYYVKQGSEFDDVTPIRSTTSAGDVTFAAANGSSLITVTDTSHGAQENDFVTFSGAASLGGLVIAAVLNQEYQIDSVPTVNTFIITATDKRRLRRFRCWNRMGIGYMGPRNFR